MLELLLCDKGVGLVVDEFEKVKCCFGCVLIVGVCLVFILLVSGIGCFG